MSKELRNSNPHDLKKFDEAPDNYISGYELLSLFKKHGHKIDDSNIPRFALNNNIKMIKVTRISSFGSTPTWYQQPSKSKIEGIIEKMKNVNNSVLGKEIVNKKIKEILRIFNNAKDKSVSKTSIAETVSKNLGVNCNRKLVGKVLKDKSKSQLRKKLIKVG
tara:strand:+ start:182 stop:667 length:486 start_codon:yes stop_codon:yes gene_type:complete